MSERRRVGIPRGPNVVGALRRRMWQQLFKVGGGYRVCGSAPYEAMVIVANHASHADTPALLAAFPSPYKPVVVAADDYWFSKFWLRTLLRIAIGAVPVSRSGGGYDGLVEGAQQVLGTGSSLLVFTEGTRSPDGELGDFHSGPLRIAKEFDVPLLPVALVGTQSLLPKGGRFTAGPIEVRLGEPIQPEDLTDGDMSPVVDQIRDLLGRGEASANDDAVWDSLNRLMDSKAGMAAGVVFTAICARHGHTPPAPLTTQAMRCKVEDHMSAGSAGIWCQALNGIPVKVYAAEAGRRGVPIVPLAVHAAGVRAARAFAVGGVVAVASYKAQPLLTRAYSTYLGIAGTTFAAGLSLVVRRWSRQDPVLLLSLHDVVLNSS